MIWRRTGRQHMTCISPHRNGISRREFISRESKKNRSGERAATTIYATDIEGSGQPSGAKHVSEPDVTSQPGDQALQHGMTRHVSY
jgi:hypothetical protein